MKVIPVILTLFMALYARAEPKLEVVYPNVNGEGRLSYGFAVLKLALESSGQPFSLTIRPDSLNNERIRALIQQGDISVADFGTSRVFERELLPVYFPIDFGMNGWRVMVIRNGDQQIFSSVSEIKQLQHKTAGQGANWSDVEILRDAGLPVEQASKLDGLFRMLSGKRFDYLPLGANEVYNLLDSYHFLAQGLEIEKTLLLKYHFGRLFFVSPDNTRLRDALVIGLERAFENGKLWQLFRSHRSNHKMFSLLNLKGRKQLIINNPYLTDEFNQIPEKYFLTMERLDSW